MVTLKFKSWPQYYIKEKAGVKPNTVRKIEDDPRFFILEMLPLLKQSHAFDNVRLQIINSEDPTDSFIVDQITDVSVFEDMMVISWKHKEEEPCQTQ